MRVAIIGSKSCTVKNFGEYLPEQVEEIVSGGNKGVETNARMYAAVHDIAFLEYLPVYRVYGERAPMKRNERIVQRADLVLIFWDGECRETAYSLKYARKLGKEVRVISVENGDMNP